HPEYGGRHEHLPGQRTQPHHGRIDALTAHRTRTPNTDRAATSLLQPHPHRSNRHRAGTPFSCR
ncbi:hypothetical protein, partial [Streptomyces sp. NPDC101166]|uniref:hypothetical protein n=1 Tax=Streptomyces sp. NPDC101166 TaxID=3366120 RepID=UPI0037FF3CFC